MSFSTSNGNGMSGGSGADFGSGTNGYDSDSSRSSTPCLPTPDWLKGAKRARESDDEVEDEDEDDKSKKRKIRYNRQVAPGKPNGPPVWKPTPWTPRTTKQSRVGRHDPYPTTLTGTFYVQETSSAFHKKRNFTDADIGGRYDQNELPVFPFENRPEVPWPSATRHAPSPAVVPPPAAPAPVAFPPLAAPGRLSPMSRTGSPASVLSLPDTDPAPGTPRPLSPLSPESHSPDGRNVRPRMTPTAGEWLEEQRAANTEVTPLNGLAAPAFPQPPVVLPPVVSVWSHGSEVRSMLERARGEQDQFFQELFRGVEGPDPELIRFLGEVRQGSLALIQQMFDAAAPAPPAPAAPAAPVFGRVFPAANSTPRPGSAPPAAAAPLPRRVSAPAVLPTQAQMEAFEAALAMPDHPAPLAHPQPISPAAATFLQRGTEVANEMEGVDTEGEDMEEVVRDTSSSGEVDIGLLCGFLWFLFCSALVCLGARLPF